MLDQSGYNRWYVLGLAVMLTVLVFVYPLTLGIPLLDPDEGLHASISQEMVETGNWLQPTFLGEPFPDKPIFYFWAEALSLKIFGFHEWAVRLPGLFFGFLGAVTTAVVAWRFFGRNIGVLSGLLYATMILPVALSQAAAHDVALIPCITMGILLFWESDRAKTWGRSLLFVPLIGLVLGISILTKGLIGVALIGVSYGLYLLVRRRLSIRACMVGALALLGGAIIASPWYIAMEMQTSGSYLYYYFVERHVKGFATNTQTHGGRPIWYYLPIILGGGLPWVAYLPVTIKDNLIRRRLLKEREETEPGVIKKAQKEDNGATTLCWCWLLGCTALLSLAGSKMVTYIWPVFPVIAILAAIAWSRLVSGELSDPARSLLTKIFIPSCYVGPLLLPVAMIVIQIKFHVSFHLGIWIIATIVAAAGWAPLFFWYTERRRTTLGSALLAVSLQFALIMTVLMPVIGPSKSARTLAEHFNTRGELPAKLWLVEERIGSLVFYLKPELRAQIGQDCQLENVQFADITEQTDPRTIIVLPDHQVENAQRRFQHSQLRLFHPAGRHRLYQVTDLQPRRSTAIATRTDGDATRLDPQRAVQLTPGPTLLTPSSGTDTTAPDHAETADQRNHPGFIGPR